MTPSPAQLPHVPENRCAPQESCVEPCCAQDMGTHRVLDPGQRAHLLNHTDELGESPVQLVEDAVEEAGGQVAVATEQVCHVPLQQGGGTRL